MSPELNERIDTLNFGLQGLCDDLQMDYIDHSPSFKLKDGTFNDSCSVPDGVHLTRAATNKLVSNLRLELRQGEVPHRDHRRRTEGGSVVDKAQTPNNPEQLNLNDAFCQTVAKFRLCKPKTCLPARQAKSLPQGPPNSISVRTHQQGPPTTPRGNHKPGMTSSHQVCRPCPHSTLGQHQAHPTHEYSHLSTHAIPPHTLSQPCGPSRPVRKHPMPTVSRYWTHCSLMQKYRLAVF